MHTQVCNQNSSADCFTGAAAWTAAGDGESKPSLEAKDAELELRSFNADISATWIQNFPRLDNMPD